MSKMKELMIEHLKRKRPARLEDYYNFMHDKRGIAIIFNHENCNGYKERTGTIKDGTDLQTVLETLNFEVKYCLDFKLVEIKKILLKVSKYDHTNNDCLWVTVMSHGGKDGRIAAQDMEYQVKELWENFIGDNCKSLNGKPKLFFIQACRGNKTDFGVSLEINDEMEVDSKTVQVIPQMADLLIMYSTAEGHYSFRNRNKGSWFIQALCKELKADSQDDYYDDLMHILARVNNEVAFEDISAICKFKDAKQMPNIESTLRKSIIFFNKSSIFVESDSVSIIVKPKNIYSSKINKNLCYDMSYDKRGIALIFNQEYDSENNSGVKTNGDEMKAVLRKLHFDVRYYLNLNSDEIKDILDSVSQEDHSNNDCLLVIVMTHDTKDVQFSSGDLNQVKEMWDFFVGKNCKSLIGKPKLFFIEASRGDSSDYGADLDDQSIPKTADLLVMSSTTEGHSFDNETDGSRFIHALCDEFKTNLQDDLLNKLTRASFVKQSNNSSKPDLNVGIQLANIESTLTKLIFFKPDNSSIITDDIHYNFSNPKRGIALIFNNESFEDQPRRTGAIKDCDNLIAVLEGLNFEVRDYMDLKLEQIKRILYEVSLEDHSNNDCLLVSVMSNAAKNGKIAAADEDYNVEELWENFLGENCDSLIGKPKLFFIEAYKGDLVDDVIPKFADLLIMYSTVEDYRSFRSDIDGSWFIKALFEELNTDSKDHLLSILTGVNRRVAFRNHPKKDNKRDRRKQMPIIVSTLTKSLYLTPIDDCRITQ